MWVGDINADFIRNTVFTNTIDKFVSDISLEKSWDKYKIDFTHSFDREEQTYVSTLDHFFWSEGISDNIEEAGVLHLPNNTSDHCPIYCTVHTETLYPKPRVGITSKSKPSWKKASEQQKIAFHVKLEEIGNDSCCRIMLR